jgi:hypothetical protein
MNEKKITLIGNIIKFSLITIGVILCFLVITGPNITAGEEAVTKFRDGAVMSFATTFTGFVIIACVAIILIFFILLLITDFKKGIKSMIGILAFTILYIVLNAIGTPDTSETLNLKNPVSDATVDGTHAGLITSIIGLGVAVLAVIAGPFLGRLRK